MMGWIVTGLVYGAVCYGLGYFMRGLVEKSEAKQYRKEMGLEDKECKNCKDLDLPCDPNCKMRKEIKSNGKSEKNNTEKN